MSILTDIAILVSLGAYVSRENLKEKLYGKNFIRFFTILVLIVGSDSMWSTLKDINSIRNYVIYFVNYLLIPKPSPPPQPPIREPGPDQQPPPAEKPLPPDITKAPVNPNPPPPADGSQPRSNPVVTDNSWLVDPKALALLREGLNALDASQCETAKARITALSKIWDGHSITWNAEHDTPQQAKSRQQYMNLVVGSRQCVAKKGAGPQVGRGTGPMPDGSGKMPECSTLACLDAEIAERRKYIDLLKRADPGTK
jgi:hypothetical protein